MMFECGSPGEIRISDEAGKLTCISRLTMAVLERPKDAIQAR